MGTSLWFAGNAVLKQLQDNLNLEPSAMGTMTSSVQMGFMAAPGLRPHGANVKCRNL